MKRASTLFLSLFVSLVPHSAIAADTITSFGPFCFKETTLYGRGDVGDAQELPSTDKTQLDNIALNEFGNASRVSVIKYCTDTRTAYLNSVQAGVTNGIGSEIKWLSKIGLDDTVNNATNSCGMYQVERENYRVAQLEIGYLAAGLPNTQGVIWLHVTVRDVRLKSPSFLDVTFEVGKVESFMSRQKLFFDQDDNAFIGFAGVTSFSSTKPIVQLGGLGFTCWDSDELQEKTLNDNLGDFYDEYEAIVWLLFAAMVLVIIGCVLCGCWVNQSLQQVKRLNHEREIAELVRRSASMDESGAPVSQRDLSEFKQDVSTKLMRSARASEKAALEMKNMQPKITIEVPESVRKANDADNVSKMMQVTRNANKLRSAAGGYRSDYTHESAQTQLYSRASAQAAKRPIQDLQASQQSSSPNVKGKRATGSLRRNVIAKRNSQLTNVPQEEVLKANAQPEPYDDDEDAGMVSIEHEEEALERDDR